MKIVEDQDITGSPTEKDGREPRVERSPMALAGAGMELGLVVAGMALAGWWADGRWGTGPWLMLTGLAVGLIGGTYNVWRIGRSYYK